MRLAYFSQAYPPMLSGAALVTQRLAANMAARGHSVLVLAASDTGQSYVAEQNGLRIMRLRALRNPTRHNQYFMLWPYRSVLAELRAFKPDLLHLTDFSPAALAAAEAARKLKIPRVLTLHQLPWIVTAYAPAITPVRRLTENLVWQHIRRLVGRCDAVLTPSRMIAEVAEARLLQRPTAISNGIDLSMFSPKVPQPTEGEALRQKYGLAADLPVILYVGRLDREKHVEQILQAAHQLPQPLAAQLLIVGEGTQRPALQRLSQQLHLPAHFPGYINANGDLPGLYRLATVFAIASEVEIQSSVVLEALASGLPVVATRASSMPEFIEEGVNGYLVPPGNTAEFATRLKQLLCQPAGERQAMQKAALKVAARHALTNTLAVQEAFYQTVMAKR